MWGCAGGRHLPWSVVVLGRSRPFLFPAHDRRLLLSTRHLSHQSMLLAQAGIGSMTGLPACSRTACLLTHCYPAHKPRARYGRLHHRNVLREL